MKKLFLPIFLISLFSTGINAQDFEIRYSFLVHNPCTMSSVQAFADTFRTGETFVIEEYTLPGDLSNWQNLYDALTGTIFGVETGALNENIEIGINLLSFDCNNPGSYDDPSGQDVPLFMFIGIAVIGETSGITMIDSFYYFQPGKYAFLKIPKSAAFNSLLQTLSLTLNDIGFYYYLGNLLITGGMQFDALSDPNYVILNLSHFSKFGGGKGSVNSVEENVISQIPSAFNLAQNYPNPFNPTTKIQYSIPEAGYVTLKVYNTLGVEVESLISDYKQAGTYEAAFTAKDLSSGIYFYELRLNNKSQTRKMILIK